jgi:gephyrin
MMARPVAGVRKKTVIVTLPGSPKGARENLGGIIKFLPHACKQAAGVNSRAMHAGGIQRLEKEAGISRGGKRSGASLLLCGCSSL